MEQEAASELATIERYIAVHCFRHHADCSVISVRHGLIWVGFAGERSWGPVTIQLVRSSAINSFTIGMGNFIRTFPGMFISASIYHFLKDPAHGTVPRQTLGHGSTCCAKSRYQPKPSSRSINGAAQLVTIGKTAGAVKTSRRTYKRSIRIGTSGSYGRKVTARRTQSPTAGRA